MKTLQKCLRWRIAALRGAPALAYPKDMSRPLRSVRLALHPPRRFLQGFHILLVAALWLPLSAHAAKNILVFGDSLSAGYGIAVAENWVSLLQQELARSHPEYRVVNASISGETAQGGRQRIAGALQQHRPAVVIVELGANDGLRGYSVADIETNLGRIIGEVRAARARVLLVGMRLPPNYGEPYVAQFGKIYPKLAKKYRVRLLPFLFEGVAPQQFQADNLHPTKEAQALLMHNVLKELKPLLR